MERSNIIQTFNGTNQKEIMKKKFVENQCKDIQHTAFNSTAKKSRIYFTYGTYN